MSNFQADGDDGSRRAELPSEGMQAMLRKKIEQFRPKALDFGETDSQTQQEPDPNQQALSI